MELNEEIKMKRKQQDKFARDSSRKKGEGRFFIFGNFPPLGPLSFVFKQLF